MHVFRGWAMGYKWARAWSVWHGESYDTEIKMLHCYRFDFNYVQVFGFQSGHRKASRSCGPFIFRKIDVFGPVSVLDNITCFHVAWRLLTIRLHNINCRLHNPDQRATIAMPCSSVSHGEYTLNLGQVWSTSNLVDAARTAPRRPATIANSNTDDMNLNPTRNIMPDIPDDGS